MIGTSYKLAPARGILASEYVTRASEGALLSSRKKTVRNTPIREILRAIFYYTELTYFEHIIGLKNAYLYGE